MELFNTTGFEVNDKVCIVLDEKKYFGTVVKTDDRLDRIKVDYTAKGKEPAIDWFHRSFWKKVSN
jgi:hypothetical protein